MSVATPDEDRDEDRDESPKVTRSIVMFVLTLCSVYLVYGFQWTSGNPLTDANIAWESAQFSLALMTILLCHELGHYFIAKRHGFALSVPYFLPFPFAFGTLGAVIHLRSLPQNRTALLEMGAAGPIAGFLVTIVCIVWDAPNTINNHTLEIVGSRAEYLEMVADIPIETGFWAWLNNFLGVIPTTSESMGVLIMEDPLLMRFVHSVVLGEPLSPYANLGPVAFAGWVGCLITSINLLPIGQLDGGHILNALFPKYAQRASKGILVAVFTYGLLTWKGWMVWATLLWFMRANEPIWVPREEELTNRAKVIAGVSILVFLLSIMAEPIYSQQVLIEDVIWKTE